MNVMKTKDLIGSDLDRAVFIAMGFVFNGKLWANGQGQYYRHDDSPSTNWSQGGPIIHREGIAHGKTRNGKGYAAWVGCASDFGMVKFSVGPTPLIAAMRCYVASKLGAEIEVPVWLT